tara:strand:+ start:72 stop:329 length:258 start_codon:yes stop_codon:yes gene_type:complete
MINAWSLAAEVLEGTLDETYPIMKKAPINDRDDLKRDLDTGAIVNTDTIYYEKYMTEKNRVKSQRNEITELRAEIELLKALIRDK